MQTAQDLLWEIGCEELPANGLQPFAEKLTLQLKQALEQSGFTCEMAQSFATPRRVAVLISQVAAVQPLRQIEKRGPAVQAPEAAVEGFLRSSGMTREQLISRDGYWYAQISTGGRRLIEALPEILSSIVRQFSGMKWMRWGNRAQPFWRPVEWMVLLWGTQLIDFSLWGCQSQRETYGHRFHHPLKISLPDASSYQEILSEEGRVQADFHLRQLNIAEQLKQTAQIHQAQVVIEPKLLEEVTGLVEWPEILWCEFSPEFLQVPREALISAMQHHQKCFPVVDKNEKLLPYFLTVSNIRSKMPSQVIQGNQRVMQARLSDAAFFWQQDQKIPLMQQWENLRQVIFQEKLGSLADKSLRLMRLAKSIAPFLHADIQKAERAAQLSKTDLMTALVNEFPELQGIIGEACAKKQGEPEDIALAIREQYLPRFAGDQLPKTAIGCVIALADRLDTLVGIFGIGMAPTGDKDPFALRRAAMAIARIIIEKNLQGISLSAMISGAIENYGKILTTATVSADVHQYILDRLPAWFEEQGISADRVAAVLEVERENLADIARRAHALQEFLILPEAYALGEANKRVKNILRKNQVESSLFVGEVLTKIDARLLNETAEKSLYEYLKNWQDFGGSINQNYATYLKQLAVLQQPLQQFFTDVMVDVPDAALKNNRLQLLRTVRALFLQVADLSLIQVGQ